MANEKIRQLRNEVVLGGILAELEPSREGTTKEGIPYFSFKGKIQYGPNAKMTASFKTFVKSKKANGMESTNFKKVKDWYANAVSLVQANANGLGEEGATKVEMFGSLVDSSYVNSQGALVTTPQYNMVAFNAFKEFKGQINVEGYIYSIKDEVKRQGEDTDYTGRQLMSLVTRDIFGNTLLLENLVISEDLVKPFADNDYEAQATATFYVDLTVNAGMGTSQIGGIGVQRSEGYSKIEMIIKGADPVITTEVKMLDPDVISQALKERTARLDALQEKGYLGNKAGVGAVRSAAPAQSSATVIDEDIPF